MFVKPPERNKLSRYFKNEFSNAPYFNFKQLIDIGLV